jgi:carboxylesterase
VPPSAARAFLDRVGSTDVTEVWLRDSGHVATLDHDQVELLQRTADFVARVSASETVR